MTKEFIFDREHARRINERRMDTLNGLLPDLIRGLSIKNCLDAGCGIGIFSDYLSRLGLKTVALDGREENIDEARRRYEQVEFHTLDVEGDEVRDLGRFDLTLCLGLLYHLENPLKAIRNLEALTEKILVIESMITPGGEPVATLVDEGRENDLSLRCIAFVPSESCIIKMLYSANFQKVYKINPLPDHDDFQAKLTHRRRRTMLVASRQELSSTMLELVEDSATGDLWRTIPGQVRENALRLGKKLRSILKGP